MRFPFEWGQAPGRSSTKDTKATKVLDGNRDCSCCSLMPLIPKVPERTRKRERAKDAKSERIGKEASEGGSTLLAPRLPYRMAFPFAFSPFRAFAFSPGLSESQRDSPAQWQNSRS